MTAIDVDCVRTLTGWTCSVRLGLPDSSPSRHEVTVSRADLERLARGASDPTDLVRRSFEFLLRREPPRSILPAFDLPAIARYFPEYESTIRG
ncbi:MAG: hypothetical protein AB1736_07315 [Chloroflexota bacterium]